MNLKDLRYSSIYHSRSALIGLHDLGKSILFNNFKKMKTFNNLSIDFVIVLPHLVNMKNESYYIILVFIDC